MREPDYGEIEEFCRDIDGWYALDATDHQPYERIHSCPDGDIVLKTHVSLSRHKSPSPGRWRGILATQLRCTEEQFWTALRTKKPVARDCPPASVAVGGPQIPVTYMRVLSNDLHLSVAEIEALSTEEATNLVTEVWSRPR